MFLAPGTVKHHMLGIYDKLGARNRAGAVHTARRLGIVADRREPFTPPTEPLRVLVADPVDVRRAGVLLALHGRPWIEACAGRPDSRRRRVMAERAWTPQLVLAGTPDPACRGSPRSPCARTPARSSSARERHRLGLTP